MVSTSAVTEDDSFFRLVAYAVTKMRRHNTNIEDGTVFVEGEDGRIEIGSLDDLYELFGGETYTIEYEDFGRTVDWLSLDEDNTLTFDVSETLASLDYPSDFVEELQSYDVTVGDDGIPERTAFFAEFMKSVWNSKGAFNLDEDRQAGR